MWKEMQTLPPDGRQSETALMIARGVRRLLRARGFSSVTELALTDGRRADMVAVNRDGEVMIVEVKSSPTAFGPTASGATMSPAATGSISPFRSGRPPTSCPWRRAHRRRPLWRGNRARSRTAAHGPGQPVAALRPGRRRPAAPSGRSGSDAGIGGLRQGAQRKGRPAAALNRSCG